MHDVFLFKVSNTRRIKVSKILQIIATNNTSRTICHTYSKVVHTLHNNLDKDRSHFIPKLGSSFTDTLQMERVNPYIGFDSLYNKQVFDFLYSLVLQGITIK
jgi:hypothetical protein